MRTGAFGDILMGTTLLRHLRRRWPDCHLTWLVEHSERQAIDANPFIDETLIWNGRYWSRALRRRESTLKRSQFGLLSPPTLLRALRFHNALRAKRYDIFLSFQPEEWPLLTQYVGASVRIGIFDTFARYYGAPYEGTNPYLFTHSYIAPARAEHRIDQYLLSLEALGIPDDGDRRMSLGYTEDDRREAEQFLTERGFDDKTPFIILVPNTTWPTKCWQEANWALLGDALTAQGFKVILTGSKKEKPLIESVAAQMKSPAVVAAGNLTFRQMAALIHRAALLVSGDTGPMHAAAALETPYVALFGPTSPRWYGPLSGKGTTLLHPVPCGPCDQKFCPNIGDTHEICMRLLTVEEVYAAALQTVRE